MKKLVFAVVFLVFLSGIVFPGASSNPVLADQFGLKAVGECGFVSLSWNNVKGADTYWIYRGPGKGKEYPTPLTDFPIRSTSFTDDINIENGKEYCYFVTAVDALAKEVAKSEEACTTPKCEETRQEPTCKLVLKYQIDNMLYWVNDDSKGPMETSPVILNSRMFLVIRYVTSEIEGTLLEWVAAEKKVKITTRKGNIIELWIGKKDARIDGKTIQIDPNNPKVVPVIKDGRTLLPMRFVGENLGAAGADGIKWFESTKTVEIKVDDPVCEKEGFRYPNAIQLKENYYEFSVEYHTGKNQFPEEVSLGLAKSDNTKVLRLGKSKRDKASSEDLMQVKTPEAKTEDIKTPFGKAKRYRFRLAIEPGVLHFYKFISKTESLPKEGYLGPVSAPLPNAIKIDDLDIAKFEEGNSMKLQGYFTNEPYPMIVDDYWKIFERGREASKKIMVRLEKGQIIEDGTFVCIEGQKKTSQKGMPTISTNKIIMSQKIDTIKRVVTEIEYARPPLSLICDGKYAIVFTGALDNAKVKDEDEVEHVYKRLRVDFVGEALNNYKTCFNLGICKQNIYTCFGRGDEEIDLICADDGDGNPLDFDWNDRECRTAMENDAQLWWRAGDGWSVKKGSRADFEDSVEKIQEKIDALPADITPEIYILIFTHGNTDIIGCYDGQVITYPSIIDYIKGFIANRTPSLNARSKVRILLDTCHAGSIIDNMENNLKSKGHNYIQLAASCLGDELGWGTWPEFSVTSYAGAGGTFGIPFLTSVNSQAKSNPGKHADWKVAYDYAVQNDSYVDGVLHEYDDGTSAMVYTHPQYWYSKHMTMFYNGPAFENPLDPVDQVRINTCRIGVDASELTFDACNCSKTLSVGDFPKSKFAIVNKGVFPFRVIGIEAEEDVLSKTTAQKVFHFSDYENSSNCSDNDYFDFNMEYNMTKYIYVCLVHHRLNAQPLDANGYMAQEGGLPSYIQVPIKIRYEYKGETYVQKTTARVRVTGESYQMRHETSATRSETLKGKILNWNPVETNVTIQTPSLGLPEGILAGPNTNGDVFLNVSTDTFKKSNRREASFAYLRSFKLDIFCDSSPSEGCLEEFDWGWVTKAVLPENLKNKLQVTYPTVSNRSSNKISIIFTPEAHSTEGYNSIIGRHKFRFEIYKKKNQNCEATSHTSDRTIVNLNITVEFTNPK
jgi:hypothetical protein